MRDAHELVRRKLPASADLTDRKERDKLTRRLVSMLGRKGYPSGMAFAVVKEELAGLGPTSDPGSEDGVGAEVRDTPCGGRSVLRVLPGERAGTAPEDLTPSLR